VGSQASNVVDSPAKRISSWSRRVRERSNKRQQLATKDLTRCSRCDDPLRPVAHCAVAITANLSVPSANATQLSSYRCPTTTPDTAAPIYKTHGRNVRAAPRLYPIRCLDLAQDSFIPFVAPAGIIADLDSFHALGIKRHPFGYVAGGGGIGIEN